MIETVRDRHMKKYYKILWGVRKDNTLTYNVLKKVPAWDEEDASNKVKRYLAKRFDVRPEKVTIVSIDEI